MNFHTKIYEGDVKIITSNQHYDERGIFTEIYKKSDFNNMLIPEDFVQINRSKSYKSVLRGMHFQKYPHSQGKLVQCIVGNIYDVVVNVNPESPNYLNWQGYYLNEFSGAMIYVPEDYAHGFLTLSDYAIVEYMTTKEYNAESECGMRYDDPAIGIVWPESDPKLSKRDMEWSLL
jgi:dTDP-4-dehydrorhamnose 3,5-epimerase